MFKVLILQTRNNLSDERTEFYLRDRLTWMRFLGLGLGDPVPDPNTIWTFREALTEAGGIQCGSAWNVDPLSGEIGVQV